MSARGLWIFLRGAAAAILLAWAVQQVPWADRMVVSADGVPVQESGLATCLRVVQPLPVMAGIVGMAAAILVAGLRWRLLLRAQGIAMDVGRALHVALLAEAAGLALPGTLGADAMRFCAAGGTAHSRSRILASLLVDRSIGLIVLAGMALIGVAGWRADRLVLGPVPAMVLTVFCATLVFIAFCHGGWFQALEGLVAFGWLGRATAGLGGGLAVYRQSRATLAGALALGVVAQVLDVSAMALMGLGLGLDMGWVHYAFGLPLVSIVTAIPLTPGSLGVMEEAFQLIFQAWAVPAELLAFALLVRVGMLARSIPGLILLTAGGRIRPEPGGA